MQPLQCDSHPRVAEHQGRTDYAWLRVETIQAAPAAHRRYLSSPAAPTLTQKNTVFRAPASSPEQAPCNIHAAITMRLAASRGKRLSLYAHGNKTWHQSCSHSIKICHQNFQNTLSHTRGTFHRWPQPLYTETFQHNPHATCMQPLQCVLQHHVAHPHLSTHMATKRDTNPAAIPLRSATTASNTPYLRTHEQPTTRCRTPRENRFDDETAPATPAAHTRYLSSLAAATLHGKTQGFVLRLPSNTTRMQHACSHYNAFCSTALNQCIAMRCKISHRPSWMYRYVM